MKDLTRWFCISQVVARLSPYAAAHLSSVVHDAGAWNAKRKQNREKKKQVLRNLS